METLAPIAQQTEQFSSKEKVVGAIPTGSTMDKTTKNRMDALRDLIKSELKKEQNVNTKTVATPPIKRNRCQCKRCKDIIESLSRHDWVQCSCGAIFTDGGKDYLHRGYQFDESDLIDLSEYWSETLDSEVV